jgi:RNA-directed DNA polymerase
MSGHQNTGSNNPSQQPQSWDEIDFRQAKRVVEKLQFRIAAAAVNQQHRKVRDLQRMLVKSFSARALAVKRVSVDNKGKRTPGIDGIIWDNSQIRFQAISDLTVVRKKALPLKRVEIPKPNGKVRPLGIPAMRDRAEQALWSLALLPVAESTSDRFSYGFRPHRKAEDAYEQIFCCLRRKDAAQWVLDADIKGFFDHLNHDWLLANTAMCKRTLRKWLKAGVLIHESVIDTDEGTPQGGIISPILANIALNGLERHIQSNFRKGTDKIWDDNTKTTKRLHRKTQLNIIRYADDFIVTGRSPRQLERVKESIEGFLAERGLELSQEKTSIRNFITEGFDFLGWHFQKRNGTFLGTVSKDSIKRHQATLKQTIKNSGNMNAWDLIKVLGPKINGWQNYHKVCANIWETWGKMGQWLWKQLWLWARKRHRAKGRIWIKQRYWKTVGRNNWRFYGEDPKKYRIPTLLPSYDKRQQTKIVRVPADLNVFLKESQVQLNTILFRKEMTKLSGTRKGILYARQKGICPHCNERLYEPTETHHIIPLANGGADDVGNLKLLHRECHQHQEEHKAARKRLSPSSRKTG